MKFDFKTEEEFAMAREAYFNSHPDAPQAKDIECLDLIMRKEFARQIIAGTKKLEFRDYSPFYIGRVIDKDVAKYLERHLDDDEAMMFCNDIRQVKKIHFHDYNKSWYLDVEVDYNDIFSITRDDIGFLQSEYGCHDYDATLAYYDSIGEERRPYVFYFVMGKILGTNL